MLVQTLSMSLKTHDATAMTPGAHEKSKAVGWGSVLQRQPHSNQQTDPSASTAPRPLTAGAARKHSKDAAAIQALTTAIAANSSSSSGAASDAREVPNEAIFNTQFTTAGRMFLTKVKKNRAMQVDRRTKGFEHGLEQRTVLIDAITKRHYRILLVDPDMQRREDLADALETCFEILVAPSNDRAFALLNMFKVDSVLLRASVGNDSSATSSPTIAFLRSLRDKFGHTPVSVMVPAMIVNNGASTTTTSTNDTLLKILQHALSLGVCGYFEDGLPIAVLIERLRKLLHSLVVAQTELAQCDGIKIHPKNALGDDIALPVQAIKKRGTTVNLVQRPATCKPDSITYDQHRMLLELSLNQRKQCHLQRQALTETLDSNHSVLGIELTLNESASTGLIGLASPASSLSIRPSSSSVALRRPGSAASNAPASPGGGAFQPERRRLAKMIPPLPSQYEISKRIYAKPQEIQQKIQSHLYGQFHATKHDVLPQDPLLHHCVVIDPQSFTPAGAAAPPGGKRLLIAKAYLLFQEQRYDEALQQTNRAIKMESNNLVKIAHLLRGALYDLSGDHARAEREFGVALKLDPSLHQAHFNRSVSLLKLGRDADALAAISLALQAEPLNETYLRNRALIYRRTGNFVQAQTEYAKLETLPSRTRLHSERTTTQAAPAGSLAKAATTTTRVLERRDSMTTTNGRTSTRITNSININASSRSRMLEDGVFNELFGKPADCKVALVCPSKDRTPAMVDSIVALLQTVLVFQDFAAPVLRHVAELLEYEVVSCGKRFALGEEHPQNFYVVLHGTLSVRRKCGDFASSVTTHHLDSGMTFGCTGHSISLSTQLIADESTEVGILWPDAYDASIRSYCAAKNSEVFKFLQSMKAFKHFSTSDLGHIIGISERKRFRKGETILAQNDVPKHLCILWKGSCLMYQDFDQPPLCKSSNSDSSSDNCSSSDCEDGDTPTARGDDVTARPTTGTRARRRKIHRRDVGTDHDEGSDNAKRVLPFHRYIATPNWPLGFETSSAQRHHTHKQVRGRRNALQTSGGRGVSIAAQLVRAASPATPSVSERLKPDSKNALITALVAPAIFGESTFREQDHQRAKCSIVADCIVEMLFFDHLRLQEMDLAPEVVREISDHAPKCLSERQVAQRKAEKESWSEYKNLRLLEVSKARWPESKKHLRLLSNGCSIMLAGQPAPRHEDD